MIFCPRGRTSSKCSLVWDIPSLYCNDCFAPSPNCPTVPELLNISSLARSCIVVHNNEVRSNRPGSSDQTHMGKKHLIPIAIPDYRTSVENVEPSPPVQHNASPDGAVMVSFRHGTEMKPSLSKSIGVENRFGH
ncbi:hypothetical protein TNCV_1355191 [Trichonephila clavipes]|uniref:Uncharacterized protein n=1 Tax=Trichonephila clavipes TaxID=2585209 RepID=A0A8X6VJB7_TRICX|nr:hypothetical protein TNCV_1355191 [Trichonephila clavipes]